MKLLDWIKIALILLSGFLTLILENFIPVGGGGISLIFVITVPVTVGLSIITSLIYFWLYSKKRNMAKNMVFILTIIVNVYITFSMYPYDN